MQRRNFITTAAISAIAVSTTGFIRFNGLQFEGDCETTTDILGPFYRPDAPVRSNMRLQNSPGLPVVLTGQIKHKDCIKPLAGASVELWHCDEKGVYDNDSAEFKFRAKTYCDDKGMYSFKTILPVPYDIGNGTIRPAHFHLLISANGYQSLITQLYFNGDKHIAKDIYASVPAAKRRILQIADGKNNEKLVTFNVSMMDKLPPDPMVLERLAGIYNPLADGQKTELFTRDKMLWIKNSASINGGYPLQYNGDNKFELYGRPGTVMQFKPNMDGSINVTVTEPGSDGAAKKWEALKNKS